MSNLSLHQLLSRRYKMLVFDWDGTAVASRSGPVDHLIWRTEALLGRGVWFAAVTGTNFANLDRQFFSLLHLRSKGNLLACVNRGSEVYGFDSEGCAVRLWAREATPLENRMIDEAIGIAQRVLKEQHGLATRVIFDRMNRRKLDIMPFREWEDPPKGMIGELLARTQARLENAGLPGIQSVIDLVRRCSEEVGLEGRVTSDVKHVELGLTDKSDSVDYLVEQVAKPHGIDISEILFIGDEFGSIGGSQGSDSKMITPKTEGAVFISVGQEPEGVPPPVYHMGGGIESFSRILDRQMNVWRDDGEPMSAGKESIDSHLLLLPAEDNKIAYETSCQAETAASYETLFTLTNGYLSVRGAHEDGLYMGNPGSFVAGVFDKASGPYDVTELVVIQDPLPIEIRVNGERVGESGISDYRRELDMPSGILRRAYRWRDRHGRMVKVESERFVSVVDEHLLCIKLSLTMERGSGRVLFRSSLDGDVSNSGVAHLQVERVGAEGDGSAGVCTTTIESGIGVATACAQRAGVVKCRGEAGRESADACAIPVKAVPYADRRSAGHNFEALLEEGESIEIHKFVTVHTSRDVAWRRRGQQPGMDELLSTARANASEAASLGFSECKQEHIEGWRRMWERCDILLDGPDRDRMAVRFALFHLASLGPKSDDTVSIAAKGLHGEGYKGHVFWDTEIFILPFFVVQFPDVARRLLMYRYRTLPGARRKARDNGYRGAMYAWESADSGDETTPKWSRPHPETGERVRIWCGELEDHITADVAYAVWNYCRRTGDWDFMQAYGMEMIVEAARFWASRAEWNDVRGRYDILRVIGPDEFHEHVDNNAFTNYIARWTLLKALDLAQEFPEDWDVLACRLGIDEDELDEIRRVADLLYLPPPNPDSGVVEQFEGYYGYNDVDLVRLKESVKGAGESVEEALGRERLVRSKLLKQADIVMLGCILPDLFDKEIWNANWRYYEPRTTHLSSLSASAHSAFASYLGLSEDGYAYFERCISIELEDEKGNLKDGIHAANLGGMWQAVVYGFAGIRLLNGAGGEGLCSLAKGAAEPVIAIDPRLPRRWDRLQIPFECQGRRLRVVITPYRVTVVNKTADAQVVAGDKSVIIECRGRRQRVPEGQSVEFILA
jgi:trehalose/maltose hydrolase-like predicted phosphorylase/hydroxymethylpyrimidine pyrophosphatase-like HAD family hydrolase